METNEQKAKRIEAARERRAEELKRAILREHGSVKNLADELGVREMALLWRIYEKAYRDMEAEERDRLKRRQETLRLRQKRFLRVMDPESDSLRRRTETLRLRAKRRQFAG